MEEGFISKKSVDTGKGRIFYFADNSHKGKPAVVFLHGLSSNHTTWLDSMKILHENGYNSVAPDLRGHGFSDKSKIKKNYDFPVFSGDLRKVLEREKFNKIILVGYCFGGEIALDYASKYPENINELVLISVNHSRPLKYGYIDFLTPIVSGALDLLAFLLLWQKRKEYHYYEHGKAVGYWDSVWDGLRTMPVSVNFWMLANVFRIDLSGDIKKIKTPTTIIYSKKDLFVTKTEIGDMIKSIKNSKEIASSNPNHFIGTNDQGEVVRIVLNLLKEIK